MILLFTQFSIDMEQRRICISLIYICEFNLFKVVAETKANNKKPF